ncbi:MAG: hypothetical protein WC449_06310 [Candidatus Paceibacterota bacterium]
MKTVKMTEAGLEDSICGMQGDVVHIGKSAVPELLKALELAETALGENLQWIADVADLRIRQKDRETLAKLDQLTAAWKACVAAIAKAKETAS